MKNQINIISTSINGITGYEFFSKFFNLGDSGDYIDFFDSYITSMFNKKKQEFHKKEIILLLEQSNENNNCMFIDDTIESHNYVLNISRKTAISDLEKLEKIINNNSKLPYIINITYCNNNSFIEQEDYEMIKIKIYDKFRKTFIGRIKQWISRKYHS